MTNSLDTKSKCMIIIDPPQYYGIKELNKNLFKKEVKFIGMIIAAEWSGKCMKNMTKFLHHFARIKRILNDSDLARNKILLLDPELFRTVESAANCEELIESYKLISSGKEPVGFKEISVSIDFDNYWTAEEIINAVIPPELDFATSFEIIGHIAHFNLRDEILPFKHLIGQVVLEKHKPLIRLVVNKTGKIETVFRTFKMEILASVSENEKFEVEVKENECRFRFDFSKTYWNSRLQNEHESLVKLFKPGEWICDVCCGVGPFALPAALKGCNVLANDLNPDSIAFLKNNIKINKMIRNANIQVFNMDGREFMKEIFKNFQHQIDHVVMNLPATAIEFLDTFKGAQFNKYPKQLHVYCFAKEDEAEDVILKKAEQLLGETIKNYKLYHVRKVAPNKEMFRFSFMFPCLSDD